MIMNESVTEFLRFFLSSPTFCSVRVGGVVVVGICGDTDSGSYVSPPSHPVFPLSLNVVNECCMKSLRSAYCWIWTLQSVLRATTTINKKCVCFFK